MGENKLSLKDRGRKTFETNILTIAVNILYTKEKEILPVYISKHNSTSEKTIILLKILNHKKEWKQYLAVKSCLHYWEE